MNRTFAPQPKLLANRTDEMKSQRIKQLELVLIAARSKAQMPLPIINRMPASQTNEQASEMPLNPSNGDELRNIGVCKTRGRLALVFYAYGEISLGADATTPPRRHLELAEMI